ncbi:hypothetical protein KC887_02355 [Candidatus Kaiserbacteria bacterium]|nr:hypothetical protein [Candidatus Kaiserbacteria bacterium]
MSDLENMPRREFQQYILEEDPVKYRVGNLQDDGHVHYIYLRDEVPIATTNAEQDGRTPHQHTVTGKTPETLICEDSQGHIHEEIVKIGLKDT